MQSLAPPSSLSIHRHHLPATSRTRTRRAPSSVARAALSSAPAFLPAPLKKTKPAAPLSPAIGAPAKPVVPASSPRSRKSPAQDKTKQLNFFQRAAAAALDAFEEGFVSGVLERPHGLPKTADPAVQIAGNFAPVGERPPVHDLPVSGRIPPFINGVYARNGANPCFDPVAGHHLFDGDGMVHALRIRNGAADSYACRFTDTAPAAAGEGDRAARSSPRPSASCTATRASRAPRALLRARAACGLVDPTQGTGVAKTPGLAILQTAASSPCPRTTSPTTCAYDVIKKPYLRYFYFRPDGTKSDDVEIPLDQPTMIHDFAITENHVVVPDHQVVFKLQEMLRGGSPVVLDKEKTSRFGVLPKYAESSSEMVWVDVPDCFCFHLWNAWEEEDEVVVIGSCMTPADSIFNDSEDRLESVLTEIRLNTRTGQSTRRPILPPSEAGQPRGGHGQPQHAGPQDALRTGELTKFEYGEGRFGGEPCFVPMDPAYATPRGEDDGYVLAFVHDEQAGTSELLVVNAADMRLEATVQLPSRVPFGFHGTFITDKELQAQA
ncbi:hypothetical protein PR202_gb11626 [Eleusine coracana subsp. coracana]|uniref:9-cis-epoxycarotenoid dioxygenase n=1 Tax=Eleusine coracana subsp. coracana TaxID=191504 RepID=A0AAV5EN07_ELECO|nr:hypothetical protein PR202_gb11626 [Eleusine coracana subsp. coracana]